MPRRPHDPPLASSDASKYKYLKDHRNPLDSHNTPLALSRMLRSSLCRVQRPPSTFSNPAFRSAHTSPGLPTRGRLLGLGLGAGALGLSTLGLTAYADSGETSAPNTSLGSLARSYLVYSLCSVSPLVNHSPAILSTCASIPGLRELSEAVVRRTFFAQVRHFAVR